VAQVIECLLSKYEVLSSNSRAAKKKKVMNALLFKIKIVLSHCTCLKHTEKCRKYKVPIISPISIITTNVRGTFFNHYYAPVKVERGTVKRSDPRARLTRF
jgi:hypothetical protein